MPRKRWRVFIAALAVIALASVTLALWMRQRAAPTPNRRMLAVLPFDNFTGDPAQEHFCDGLTEELISTLSQLSPSRLGVIARTSAMRYKTGKPPLNQIKTELGVDYLVEGSVRNEAGQVRITAQLMRVSDQSHLWALSFDRSQGDTLKVQREVSASVARSLALALLPARTPKPESNDPLARAAYLKGKYQLAKRDPDAPRQALEFFRQAIAADPTYAAAFAALAEAQMQQNLPPREKLAQVRATLNRALELDETLAEAHCLAGELALKIELDWTRARQEFERALELEPGRAKNHHEFAFYFSALGLHDEAIARLQNALPLDPVSPLVQGDLGWLYLRARRYDEAIQQARKTLELEPKDIGAHYCLFHAFRLQGKRAEAANQARTVMQLAGAKPVEIAQLAAGDAGQRLLAYQRWEIKILLDRGARSYLDPAVLAMSYADLGDTEKALQLLQQAARAGSGFLAALRSEPRYDPLRSDPRFVELVTRFFPKLD